MPHRILVHGHGAIRCLHIIRIDESRDQFYGSQVHVAQIAYRVDIRRSGGQLQLMQELDIGGWNRRKLACHFGIPRFIHGSCVPTKIA